MCMAFIASESWQRRIHETVVANNKIKMELTYDIVLKKDITQKIRKEFGEALNKQGKVIGDVNTKADRCMLLCIARNNNEVIGVGGIKVKTQSDFNEQKANLPELESLFDWELGYLYTSAEYRGQGIASKIVARLIEEYGDNNLMASTEVEKNPGMVKILSSNGFEQKGKSWQSGIHKESLGLYLKFSTRKSEK